MKTAYHLCRQNITTLNKLAVDELLFAGTDVLKIFFLRLGNYPLALNIIVQIFIEGEVSSVYYFGQGLIFR